MPEVDRAQRRRTTGIVWLIYLTIAAVAAAAALIAHSFGAGSSVEIASAILAVVTCLIIAIVVGAVVELRKRR